MNAIEKITEHLMNQRNGYQPTANYAYNAGHPCERHLVYSRLNWEEKSLHNINTLLIFREGNLHEEAVITLLRESGIKIVETQRPFELKAIQLRGRIDGQCDPNDEGKLYPTEIKSMNPFDWEKINSVEDMMTSTKVWIKSYPTQMMLYLLGMEKEVGLFILKNKLNGMLKFIFCPLDYAYAEKEWQKLERVNKHVLEKTYPDRIADRSVCTYCDFKHICLPDENSETINILENQELFDLLEQREKLKDSAKDYEQIDEKIKKDYFKNVSEGTHLVGGKFQIKISMYDRKFANIPDDIKKQYEETKTATRINIVALK